MSYSLVRNQGLTKAEQIPNTPGTYALFLHLAEPKEVSPGRLGTFSLARGWYVYTGSALGPGGLRARISRHLKPIEKKHLHWHIDYLTTLAPIEWIAWVTSDDRRECQWARYFTTLPGASIPIPRFGASDCHCPAHLIKLPDQAITRIEQILSALIVERFP